VRARWGARAKCRRARRTAPNHGRRRPQSRHLKASHIKPDVLGNVASAVDPRRRGKRRARGVDERGAARGRRRHHGHVPRGATAATGAARQAKQDVAVGDSDDAHQGRPWWHPATPRRPPAMCRARPIPAGGGGAARAAPAPGVTARAPFPTQPLQATAHSSGRAAHPRIPALPAARPPRPGSMFRSSYDQDVTCLSPQGRLFQVGEGQGMRCVVWRALWAAARAPGDGGPCAHRRRRSHAHRPAFRSSTPWRRSSRGRPSSASRCGHCQRGWEDGASAAIAGRTDPPPFLQSNTHAILAALKRAPSDLATHQRKVFKVDDGIGAAVAGLVADGRSLVKAMRSAALSHRFVYEAGLPPARLVRDLADRAQVATQRSWKRPLGVGVLVAGVSDATGPSLHYLCPSGTAHAYRATAVGARSQACRTSLERAFESFPDAPLADLASAALRALAAAAPDGGLTPENATLAIVGVDTPFTLLEGDDLAPYLAAIGDDAGGGGNEGGGDAAAGDAPAPMVD